MLKDFFVKISSNRGLKKTRPASKGYLAANFVGIIINTDDRLPNRLSEFVSRMEQDQKLIHIIGITSRGKVDQPAINPLITKNDVSLLGEIKSEAGLSFISQPFDLVIILDRQGHPMVKLIASKCHPSHFVGFHVPNSDWLNMRVKPKSETELEDLYKYLKLISSDNE
ncbi:MAG: hypothetical protein JXQ90_03350 [Cyclobacteriaceae bacterium]